MAGINRLGKAPPKPGQLRPLDPNRHKTVDIFSDGTENDAEYQKMVNDIEEMQNQQGWLFSKGAFDKGDLLYLRDTAEQQRQKELEMRDNELAQFTLLRQKAELDAESARDAAANRAAAAVRKVLDDSRPKLIPKIKPKAPDLATAGPGTTGSSAKRQKQGDAIEGLSMPQSNTAMLSQARPSKDLTVNTSVSKSNGSAALCLLCNYSSNSESEGEDEKPSTAPKGLGKGGVESQQVRGAAGVRQTSKIALPSAADLLGDLLDQPVSSVHHSDGVGLSAIGARENEGQETSSSSMSETSSDESPGNNQETDVVNSARVDELPKESSLLDEGRNLNQDGGDATGNNDGAIT